MDLQEKQAKKEAKEKILMMAGLYGLITQRSDQHWQSITQSTDPQCTEGHQ